MDPLAALNEFLIFHNTADPQPPGPTLDFQRLNISPQRNYFGGQEPNSGGQNSGTGSATMSETKKQGKFKFLTIPGGVDGQPNSDSTTGGSPYRNEPSSAESCDEPQAGPSSGVPRDKNLLPFVADLSCATTTPCSSRSNQASIETGFNGLTRTGSSVPANSTAWSSSSEQPPRERDEETFINKQVKRLLKATTAADISESIAEEEEDFDEDDEDLDARLDQLIAEDEQSKKKGRKRTASKGSMAKRRSTRNSRKDDGKPDKPMIPLIMPIFLPDKKPLPPVTGLSLQPKKRGRKKKVEAEIAPEKTVSEASEREASVPGKDTTSDETTSQMSEVKPDSEDLNEARPGKLKTRWVELVSAVSDSVDELKEERPRSLPADLPVVKEEEVRPVPVEIPVAVASPQTAVLESREESAPVYTPILDCVRLSRNKIRNDREARKMRCDCIYTVEEADYGMKGCPEGCMNRLLFIECGPKCAAREKCSNKRFQRKEYADLEIFQTGLKGHGLRTKQALAAGQFICEYVGEVLDARQFKKRQKEYHNENIQHHYFMALNKDEVIDATRQGNCTRFTNHSCDPNAETQKWTVGGNLRIGFFAVRAIAAGEEITFDYQFERYGKQAQRCFCGTALCRGFIGSVSSEDRKKTAKGEISDRKMNAEIDKFAQSGALRTGEQALRMARLLLRVEEDRDRLTLLRVIVNSDESLEGLKAFLRCQGLMILSDLMAICRNSSSEMKLEILNALHCLPLTSRNQLENTKVWEKLQRWAGIEVPKEQNSLATSALIAAASEQALRGSGEENIEPSSHDSQSTIDQEMPSVESPTGKKDSPLMESANADDLPRSVLDDIPKQNGGGMEKSSGIKKEVDEDSQDTQDTLEEQTSKDDVDEDELVRKSAAELLQHFTDNLKKEFKIPKKQNQDREPFSNSSEDTARKSPVKSTPIAPLGTTIPTLAPGWSRGKRSPSPTGTDLFLRTKQPRFSFPRHDRPFPFFPRRPPMGTMFPHHGGSFLPPPFAHVVPMESGGPVPDALPSAVITPEMVEAVKAEQNRLNLELASKLVSSCLYNGTVSDTRKVMLQLKDGSKHDARTFKPSAEQIAALRSELPVIGTPEWEEKGAMVRSRLPGLELHVMDAPVTREVVGWTANFDLSKHHFILKDWCTAFDRAGRMYFYNISTGIVRWDFPSEEHVYSTVLKPLAAALSIPEDLQDYKNVPMNSVNLCAWSPQGDDEESPRENIPSRSGSSTSKPSRHDRSSRQDRHRKPEKSQAILKKRKIDFQSEVCTYVLQVLNSYRSPQCTQGKIESKDDFKYLARKFTHNVLEQEIKRHRNTPDALIFSSKHKPKIKEHIKKYMSRFGRVYKAAGSGESRAREEECRKNLVEDDDLDDEEDDEEEEDGGEDENDEDMEREQKRSAALHRSGGINGDANQPDDLAEDDVMDNSGEPVPLPADSTAISRSYPMEEQKSEDTQSENMELSGSFGSAQSAPPPAL